STVTSVELPAGAITVDLVTRPDARIDFDAPEIAPPETCSLAASSEVLRCTARLPRLPAAMRRDDARFCGAGAAAVAAMMHEPGSPELGALRCDGGALVAHEGWPIIVRRCTPSGCASASTANGPWPTRLPDLVASGQIAGRTIVVWRSEHDGIRMRLGAPSELGLVRDVVLFDDFADDDGAPRATSSVHGLYLLTAGARAIVLLSTTSGVRAIRVRADRTFAPADVER
ncbi:MAG TPA: hypothetical protein VHB21_09650, partial [Minicystis sp.]|nr:hypothetical protein [Minicystis sp.]